MKKPRTLTPEERALWQESNRHTTAFKPNVDAVMRDAIAVPRADAPLEKNLVEATAVSAPARPRKHAPLPELSRREASKRLKQHPTIDATLDLHGMNKLEAMEKVARFITRHHQLGHRHVVIVTGKGRGTTMGVLRAALPDWLNEPALRPLISTITHARPEKGGEGVSHVLLKHP
jgi:DNA-nicking Smr family endonuclease